MEYIISLGGSCIVPEKIDTAFVKSFKALIEERVAAGDRFFIVAGGGKICRVYQDAAKKIADVSETNLDWIGIKATALNAELIRTICRHASFL